MASSSSSSKGNGAAHTGRRVASPPPTDPQTRSESLSVAARALRTAEQLCVLTGAGISAESGIPTFRDAMAGYWAQFKPEELATPEAFAKNPNRVWQWYAARRALVRSAQPNAGHLAIASLTNRVSHFTLITQNVDNLHQRAGSRNVVSLHGSLMRAKCSAGCPGTIEPTDEQAEAPPVCDTCGALMRPDVVWFGERMPMAQYDLARTAAVACDVFLSVGTSNLVEPAASLPWVAAAHGAMVIIVNPSMAGQRRGPSVLAVEGPAGVILPRLVAEAFAGKRPRRAESASSASVPEMDPSATGGTVQNTADDDPAHDAAGDESKDELGHE